jgi:cellobiose-specific phosphotransferase system component IIA
MEHSLAMSIIRQAGNAFLKAMQAFSAAEVLSLVVGNSETTQALRLLILHHADSARTPSENS